MGSSTVYVAVHRSGDRGELLAVRRDAVAAALCMDCSAPVAVAVGIQVHTLAPICTWRWRRNVDGKAMLIFVVCWCRKRLNASARRLVES